MKKNLLSFTLIFLLALIASSARLLAAADTVSCADPVVDSITASSASVCNGNLVTITVAGSLNDATAWHLYSGSCGGLALDSNATGIFTTSPALSGTYFIRGEGGCVTAGTCDSVNIGVITVDTSMTVLGNMLTAHSSSGTFQWFNCDMNTPIAGETDSTFFAFLSGNYSVIVTDNGCVDTSGCAYIFIICTCSINGSTCPLHGKTIAYPNPAVNKTSIDLGEQYSKVTVELMNAQGTLIRTFLFENRELIELEMKGLPAGVYFAKVHAPRNIPPVKIIKE
jgi:hypothetical protein